MKLINNGRVFPSYDELASLGLLNKPIKIKGFPNYFFLNGLIVKADNPADNKFDCYGWPINFYVEEKKGYLKVFLYDENGKRQGLLVHKLYYAIKEGSAYEELKNKRIGFADNNKKNLSLGNIVEKNKKEFIPKVIKKEKQMQQENKPQETQQQENTNNNLNVKATVSNYKLIDPFLTDDPPKPDTALYEYKDICNYFYKPSGIDLSFGVTQRIDYDIEELSSSIALGKKNRYKLFDEFFIYGKDQVNKTITILGGKKVIGKFQELKGFKLIPGFPRYFLYDGIIFSNEERGKHIRRRITLLVDYQDQITPQIIKEKEKLIQENFIASEKDIQDQSLLVIPIKELLIPSDEGYKTSKLYAVLYTDERERYEFPLERIWLAAITNKNPLELTNEDFSKFGDKLNLGISILYKHLYKKVFLANETAEKKN